MVGLTLLDVSDMDNMRGDPVPVGGMRGDVRGVVRGVRLAAAAVAGVGVAGSSSIATVDLGVVDCVNCCSGSMYHGVYGAGAGACTHVVVVYPAVSLFAALLRCMLRVGCMLRERRTRRREARAAERSRMPAWRGGTEKVTTREISRQFWMGCTPQAPQARARFR